ncbi:hypothetical protein G3C06_004275 [Salmonella enterica]|nr:hypothetical protein [Salmonella enterica subsp. enterica serovar Javiana]EDT6613618.1 hypothetical protein [Salmonella enterica subsp. enterica]EDV4380380.1 hypothetical protein [Salmonella enterica subsp. enterica serovar Singapore]EDV5433407.1 hypothetical protein [Salmonella enterica subsp. enterica serovar Thompson]EDX9552838.1 hypothetical protein [Salmonella enterica]
MHQNACKKKLPVHSLRRLANWCFGPNASALKPLHKAGRRGGESIARQRWCVIIKIIV